jgi:PAS domain S-box-containing protein
MGILAVGNTARSDLTDSDRHLMISIAAQTAVAVNSLMTFRQLEESEALFREAFEYAATGIVLAGPDGSLRASNRYLQQMLGCSEAELAQLGLEDIAWPEDRAIGEDAMKQLAAGRQRFVQVEKRLRRKSGEAVWARMNGSLMRDSAGRPVQYIFHIRDLSAEKAAESDKQHLESQLRQAQKMEAIGTLAGGIAHDFNNILSAVGGYTELAMMQLPGNAEVRGNLEHVKAAADRAADLVQQILAFSRQSENERIVLQIGSIVKEALQLIRASLPSTIEIRKAIDTQAGSIMADPTQVHQIVMNLCTNAMHAMQAEGGLLEVRLRQVSLSRDAARTRDLAAPGDYVQLTVSDTGCGMDARTRERIFDPYFTTKAKGKGTGLGLAVVHGIVESYQGAIAVTSTPGQGTRFDVFFPVTDGDQRPMDTGDEEDFSGRERVLFVDDEPMLVDLGRTILAKQGYQVTGMTDPREALAVFRQAPDRFDIVVTDLTMPGLTGDRLAEAIAAIRPDVPVLLCSGYVQHGSHPCLAGTLHKPLQMQGLSRAVREALDQRPASTDPMKR